MKKSSTLSEFIVFLVSSVLLTSSHGDPRAQTVQVTCSRSFQQNSTMYLPNFVSTMENISKQIPASGFGVAVAGSPPYASYGLAQCYGDLSLVDCVLCYSQVRTVLQQCFPKIGGRVFLDGCFMRSENYTFYQEYTGPQDTAVCGNQTQKDSIFKNAAKNAVMKAVTNAPNNQGYARVVEELPGSTTMSNESAAYVLANCWDTLNVTSCHACLQNASSSVLGCLPWSEGRALNTGCFMRYSDYDFLNKEAKNGRNSNWTVIIVVSVVSCLVVLAVGAATGLYLWKLRTIQKKRKGSNDAERLVKTLRDTNLNFKYSTLETATRSFAESNMLGQGGFGTVYKGILPDGREIAVKRLFFNNRHRAGDFYNEVNIIRSLEHKNLVRLLGCSCSGPESLLVYEFLPRKSLDLFIFDPIRGRALNWEKRYDIIVGTTEGLVYLHENNEIRIIHRDIKASNILLDSRFRAKIADFGLARSFEEDKSHISTAIAGTLGYMAPEYLAHGQLTEKADVYSFGVLMLEIVTGRQNNRGKELQYSESLVSNVWKHFKQEKTEQLFDPNLTPDEYDDRKIKDEVLRVVHIGLLCTQEISSQRPPMVRVLHMLKNMEEELPAPGSPPFTDSRTMEFNDICENPRRPVNEDSSASVATMTLSSFYAR